MTWADFVATHNVSRETLERLEAYQSLLLKWQKQINLIGPSTADQFWTRHVLDSAQIWAMALDKPDAAWMDIGTGAGFPGLIVATLSSAANMHLVETSAKRCAFLREAVRVLGLQGRVRVDDRKIEAVLVDETTMRPDIVTARAFTSLANLMDYVMGWAREGTRLLFPKGADVQRELAEAEARHPNFSQQFDVRIAPSDTDSAACILDISYRES